MAKRSMEEAPEDVQHHLRTHAGLFNKPDLGVYGNYAYATAQLNIACATWLTESTSFGIC